MEKLRTGRMLCFVVIGINTLRVSITSIVVITSKIRMRRTEQLLVNGINEINPGPTIKPNVPCYPFISALQRVYA